MHGRYPRLFLRVHQLLCPHKRAFLYFACFRQRNQVPAGCSGRDLTERGRREGEKNTKKEDEVFVVPAFLTFNRLRGNNLLIHPPVTNMKLNFFVAFLIVIAHDRSTLIFIVCTMCARI